MSIDNNDFLRKLEIVCISSSLPNARVLLGLHIAHISGDNIYGEKLSPFPLRQDTEENCLPQWRGETRAETAQREKMLSVRAR